MATSQIKVQTPSPQEFVDWVLSQGQFCPSSGKELLQAAMIIQELQRIAEPRQKSQPSEREINAIEALRRLRRWGGVTKDSGFDSAVVLDIVKWLDEGMNDTLPPLDAHLSRLY